jgi:hypothetical protein
VLVVEVVPVDVAAGAVVVPVLVPVDVAAGAVVVPVRVPVVDVDDGVVL